MKLLPTREDLIKELVRPGSVGAEIGVYRGGFSRKIAECGVLMLYAIDAWARYKEYEKDSLCHTNQDDNCEATKRELAPWISQGKCEVIRSRSTDAAQAWVIPLDFIFLDSNHAYEFVKADLEAWEKYIKPDGVIMCHDFTETSAGAIQMGFGVVRAVNEFCANHGWEITHVTQEGDWPSCALRRKFL